VAPGGPGVNNPEILGGASSAREVSGYFALRAILACFRHHAPALHTARGALYFALPASLDALQLARLNPLYLVTGHDVQTWMTLNPIPYP
jgi:hypothetical protein